MSTFFEEGESGISQDQNSLFRRSAGTGTLVESIVRAVRLINTLSDVQHMYVYNKRYLQQKLRVVHV